eukprot:SAG25_NODE_2713_length_1427_cov_1.460843_1_plen_73_part_00
MCQLMSRYVSEGAIRRLGGRGFTLLGHTVCTAFHCILAAARRPWHLLLSYPPLLLAGMTAVCPPPTSPTSPT